MCLYLIQLNIYAGLKILYYNMKIYLCAILFGIILSLLYNYYNTNKFSVGIPPCPSITSQYTNSTLDWSTDQNPYGTPMITDTHHYIIQGTCDTCSD